MIQPSGEDPELEEDSSRILSIRVYIKSIEPQAIAHEGPDKQGLGNEFNKHLTKL
jgi:hypothetical protein